VNDGLRILITGFGPFPGAPFNPTEALVARLTRLRRPALADVELAGHIFPVTYAAVDRQLPELLAMQRPQAALMFGLAARTPYLRVETRARNAVTTLWPDADHTRVRKGSIGGDVDARRFGPHAAKLLQAALGTGVDARQSTGLVERIADRCIGDIRWNAQHGDRRANTGATCLDHVAD